MQPIFTSLSPNAMQFTTIEPFVYILIVPNVCVCVFVLFLFSMLSIVLLLLLNIKRATRG